MKKILFLFLFFLGNSYGYSIFVDKNSTFTFKDILALKGEFKDVDYKSLNRSKSTLWIKHEFKNIENRKVKKIVFFPFVPFESIDMYYQNQEGKSIKVSSGTKVRLSEREISSSNILFKVPLEPYETKEFYFQLKTQFFFIFHYEVYESFLEFWEKNRNEILLSNLGTAITMAIFIILVIMFFILRKKIYLNYSLFLLSTVIVQLLYTGFFLNFFPMEHFTVWFVGFMKLKFIAALLFLNEIFEFKKHSKIIYWSINIFIVIIFFSLIFTLVTDDYLKTAKFTLSFILFVNIYAIVKKMKHAKVLFIGWGFFVIPLLVVTLLGNHSKDFDFSYVPHLQYLFTIESYIFLSLLAYLARNANNEYIKAQQDLFNQSKFATIGEALSNIEHQWRIPLNRASSIVTQMYALVKFGKKPSSDNLLNGFETIDRHLQYMSETMADFRNFYVKDRQKDYFNITEQINYALTIFSYYIEKNAIQIHCQEKSYLSYGYGKDFAQIVLNLLSNSKNIFIEREVESPKIIITQTKETKGVRVKFKDNGGGVSDPKIISKPFFSNSGTGLGLFMVEKIIIERLSGEIAFFNEDGGLVVELLLPLEKL
ncbi:MAG: sensor histidine kinase [Campylobacterales bacterium]|nr:sensor histidine kinase [Campylobacterales bacterium]